MARLLVDYYSDIMRRCCQLEVIIPQVPGKKSGGKHPVLYLLHGTFGDQTIWGRRTSLERYVNDYDIAVITPAGQLSAYANMARGERYLDHIAVEIPAVAKDMFPICGDRENTYIAGLSMGGYGAMKIGLLYPDNYAGIGALSCGNQPYFAQREGPDGEIIANRARLAFGKEKLSGAIGDPKHDLFVIAGDNLNKGKKLPSVYMACGTEDRNMTNAVTVRDYFLSLEGNPYNFEFHTGPGAHDWEFWDIWIKHYLDTLDLEKTRPIGRWEADLKPERS